jgi:tetratricopeptide (TPR) repeat protein
VTCRVALCRELFGEDHPDVATSLHSLGLIMQAEGREDQARAYFQQALEIRKKSFPDHNKEVRPPPPTPAPNATSRSGQRAHAALCRVALPQVAASVNSLAHVLKSQGRWDEAAEMYQVLSITLNNA